MAGFVAGVAGASRRPRAGAASASMIVVRDRGDRRMSLDRPGPALQSGLVASP